MLFFLQMKDFIILYRIGNKIQYNFKLEGFYYILYKELYIRSSINYLILLLIVEEKN